ncbi:cell envelope integrity protein TolA [Alteromonadales bacterium alter-6D02]|nr:cell envelope integrity protein TolA [Alteromonadales bacterium alter-6D02]
MALGCSVLLHLGVVVVLFAGSFISPKKPEQKPLSMTMSALPKDKPIIKAAMVNSADVERQIDKLKQQKIDAKREQQRRADKLRNERRKIQELEKLRKKRQQEKLAADRAAKRAKEQAAKEAKLAQQKIEQAKAKQKDEAEKALKAQQERQKQEKAAAEAKAKRLADEKAAAEAKAKRLADEKAAKEKADKIRKEKLRKAKEAKERAAQEALMAEQMAEEQAEVNRARDRRVLSEVEKYTVLISSAIQRHWNVDESMRGKQCVLNIKLGRSGIAYSVKAVSGDKFVCKSAEDAVYKVNNFPVSKDPAVFARLKEINLTVQPEFD